MSVTELHSLSRATGATAALPDAFAAGNNMRLDDVAKRPDGNWFTRRFVMTAPLGLHMRVATLFARTVQRYAAHVIVGKQTSDFVNGKSLMGLLTLEVLCGDEIVVSVLGDDAAEALAAIARLFADAFGERNHHEVKAIAVQNNLA